MGTKMLSAIQRSIAIAAIIYAFCPDFIIGPIDDVIVIVIAAVAEFILGFVKPHITVVPNPD